MTMLDDYMDIPRLIVKNMHGEITPGEKERLKNWLDEKEDNQEMYRRIRTREGEQEYRKVIAQLHKGAVWGRINDITRGRRRLLVRRWIKYVAIILLPLTIGALAFYALQEKSVQQMAARGDGAATIKPGKQRAELILAGGESILLDGMQPDSLANESGVTILKEKEYISYQGGEMTEALVHNELRVSRGGEFKIRLQDGTLVHLNSETRLRYPVKFTGEERRVYLSGEAYFEVAKDTTKPFIVEMEKCAVRVLGTQFNVRSYAEEGREWTTLVSGKVMLIADNGENVTLLPGEQGMADGKKLEKREVDSYLYTAWKDGEFIFRRQSLESIMNIVQRWYDVEVVFLDEWCKEVTFSGSVKRYDGFNKFTDMLKLTGSVDFKVENRVIYITKK